MFTAQWFKFGGWRCSPLNAALCAFKFFKYGVVLNKYHIVYKTTNLSNGKFYIGKHSTNDLNDGYLGSGSLLQLAIKKHGRKQFSREIVGTFESESEAYEMERTLVTEKLVASQDCYNLKVGGEGGLSNCETHWLTVVNEYAASAEIILTKSIDRVLYEKINYAEDPLDYINVDTAEEIAQAFLKHSGEAFTTSIVNCFAEVGSDEEKIQNIRKRIIALNYFVRKLTGFESFPEYHTWASMMDIEEVNINKILVCSNDYSKDYIDRVIDLMYTENDLLKNLNKLNGFDNNLNLSYGRNKKVRT